MPSFEFDLRSDTVSQPTAQMREAMARAELGGDDCYGDDPSVLQLEARVAELLGKPAAMFNPSGTMSNQLAVHTHCERGEVLACAPQSHVEVHEDASAARLSGVQIATIGTPRGFEGADLEARLAEEQWGGWPRVGLVWMEQTLGLAGGRVQPLPRLQRIAEVARAAGRKLHIDGARLWNAHVASGVALADYGACADTISVSLSKGLGCPVGSLLVGDEATIERARGYRHGFGGAMRQSGVLAAAASWALDQSVDRLVDDHRRAKQLSEALGDLPGWRARPPETNICVFEIDDEVEHADIPCAKLRAAGIGCYPNKAREVRLVLHLGIDDAALETIIERARTALG